MSEAISHVSAAPRVYIRPLMAADRTEFLSLMQKSVALHHPWITPPTTGPMFESYLRRLSRDDHTGMVICERSTDAIVGVINLNNIVRGSFLSASLGYYVGAPYTGLGYMTDGLELVCRHAFERLGLHRLEANIQPDNHRSLSLVRRCGFHNEGLSEKFLYIAGAWRDHERWTRLHDRPGLR